MPPSDLLQSLLHNPPPKNIKMALARGAAPLPAEELLILMVHLAGDADPEVAAEAAKTIAGLPEENALALIKTRECDKTILEYLSRSSDSAPILEAIILNPSTPAVLVGELAKRVPEALMEAILYNRMRILECPGILENLRLNPGVTPAIERSVREIELEFFSGKRKEYSVATPEEEQPVADASEVPEPEAAVAPEIALEPDIGPDDLILEGLPLDPQEREIALAERLSKMTVPQKIRYALQGNREARAILIRDTNKEVSRTVLKSPKLADSEIQAFAAMRNISDDLLRQIGDSRQWTRNYAVVQHLVKNPKTPPLTSQRLINRLISKDLAMLARDRAVPEAVRNTAHRMMVQRTTKGKS
jgi:hypothetical protein